MPRHFSSSYINPIICVAPPTASFYLILFVSCITIFPSATTAASPSANTTARSTSKKICGLPEKVQVLPNFVWDEIQAVWKGYVPGANCEREQLLTEDILTVLETLDTEFENKKSEIVSNKSPYLKSVVPLEPMLHKKRGLESGRFQKYKQTSENLATNSASEIEYTPSSTPLLNEPTATISKLEDSTKASSKARAEQTIIPKEGNADVAGSDYYSDIENSGKIPYSPPEANSNGNPPRPAANNKVLPQAATFHSLSKPEPLSFVLSKGFTTNQGFVGVPTDRPERSGAESHIRSRLSEEQELKDVTGAPSEKTQQSNNFLPTLPSANNNEEKPGRITTTKLPHHSNTGFVSEVPTRSASTSAPSASITPGLAIKRPETSGAGKGFSAAFGGEGGQPQLKGPPLNAESDSAKATRLLEADTDQLPFLVGADPQLVQQFQQVFNDPNIPSEGRRQEKIHLLAVSYLNSTQLSVFNTWSTARRKRLREQPEPRLSREAREALNRLSSLSGGPAEQRAEALRLRPKVKNELRLYAMRRLSGK